MAKLGTYYSLCPIIDQKSLLGVTDDPEDGNVIVTLGKNIAIKYKLAVQKQLNSWRTKDKFTSPIIFDDDEKKYIAAFNHIYLRIWNDEEHLDKLKKYKFNKQIHTLIKCKNETFIIFKNGNVSHFKAAFENRKDYKPEDVIDTQNDIIYDVLTLATKDLIYIALLIKTNEKHSIIWTSFNHEFNHIGFQRIPLMRQDCDLNGFLLMPSTNNSIDFISLWSDGILFKLTLQQDVAEGPGLLVASLEPLLSCKDNITMISLNEDYIALYGADPNQEGASLIIYNIQFQVMQSKQSFKLFTNGSKLYCIKNNLFLCVGQNLAVIPFHLDAEQLAALVGSHKSVISDPDITELMIKKRKSRNEKSIPVGIFKEVNELNVQGWSEGAICAHLLPKYMENNDFESINSCLYFSSDIPENIIALLLNYILSVDGKLFKSTSKKNINLPSNLSPNERLTILDHLIALPFSDVSLLPHLRTSLNLTNSLLLLRYICYLLSEDGHTLKEWDVTKTEGKLIEWGCILLDANYQKFLLSRDDKVVELLTYFNGLVNAHLCCLDELKQIAPMLVQLKKGKSFNKTKNLASVQYSIEEMNLY